MEDVKEIILKLTEQEKEELFDYLKKIINEEFEDYEASVCECPKCGSRQILKNGTYNGIQRYR